MRGKEGCGGNESEGDTNKGDVGFVELNEGIGGVIEELELEEEERARLWNPGGG